MFAGGASAGVGGVGAIGLGGAPTNFHANMVAKGAFDKYQSGVNKSTVLGAGAFTSGAGGLLGKGDGSGTDRSTYHYPQSFNPMMAVQPKDDKSFKSPGGTAPTHGAVSALNLAGAGLTGGGNLDNSFAMKNILSTPSSGKSKSGISQEDAIELQKP